MQCKDLLANSVNIIWRRNLMSEQSWELRREAQPKLPLHHDEENKQLQVAKGLGRRREEKYLYEISFGWGLGVLRRH